jgi:hypothetical protein
MNTCDVDTVYEYHNMGIVYEYWRHTIAYLVEALYYKPEGHGLDSR